MMNCPNCEDRLTLKQWWKKSKLDFLLEWQAKYVANNVGIGVDPKKDKKYKQSERLIRKCGFYDEFTVKEC